MTANRITINGVTIEVEGNDIRIHQGVLYVDGVAVQSQLGGEIHVHWHGDLATLAVDGSVTCRDVDGDVTAGGSVQCRNVEGSVSAGGSVHARGVTAASAVGFSGDIKVTAGGGTGGTGGTGGAGASVKIGHGAINAGRVADSAKVGHGDINAGGSVHVRSGFSSDAMPGRVNAGGSVFLG